MWMSIIRIGFMRTRWAPRSFLTVALAAIAVLIGAIGWLGWRLIEQDRALARQHMTERLDSAADLLVADLVRQLAVMSDQLARIATAADPLKAAASTAEFQGDDVVVLQADARGVRSSTSLPFYPDLSDPIDATGIRFAEAEAAELAGRDLRAVLAAYQQLAASADPPVRAGGLVRVARVARRLDRSEMALSAYEGLARLGPVPAAGRPADLVAAVERCAVFEASGRRDELRAEAAGLEASLRSGRWRLSRGEYYAYLDRIRQWRHEGPPAPPTLTPAEILAEGAAAAWHDRPAAGVTGNPSSWRVLATPGSSVLAASYRTVDGSLAVVVTQPYAERRWFREATSLSSRQRIRVMLTGAGQVWFGAATPATVAVNRAIADTGLPFAVTVTSDDPTVDAGRRSLWIAMFATLGLLLLAGGYVVARGIGKELEVARLQSDFVAAVSHEFRTPVASVRQLSEILDEGRVHDEARRTRYYGLLRRESERLQRLVEGLLDFRRMESGAAEYRFEVLDPGVVVQEVADEFSGEARPAAARVSATIASGLPAVRMDREAIGRALWNLLDNAAKYSPPDSAISLEAAADDGQVMIRVRDQGPGIPTAERRKIFKKFVRGESARATGAKGTGLGLAMVAHIVRAHRGDVRVEGGPGAGSTFVIVLPAEGPRA